MDSENQTKTNNHISWSPDIRSSAWEHKATLCPRDAPKTRRYWGGSPATQNDSYLQCIIFRSKNTPFSGKHTK